jgi:cation:H+ antiporter
MIIAILFIILGFGLLIKGADWMVDGSSALAKKYNVSDLVIGLTIVAFGTSAPELVVNSFASIDNHPDIIFGNVIGSNIFNLFVIFGMVGLISPIVVKSSTVWKEIPISFFALVIMYFLCNDLMTEGSDILTRWDGLILIALFGSFLFYIFRQMKSNPESLEIPVQRFSNLKITGFIIGGLAGLVIGGKLVVDYAIIIASTLGVSQKIIGLTIIAAGTSLPELTTSIVAAMKKNSDIAIGNVIGSNIFNILLILSVSSLIQPIIFSVRFNFEIYLLAGGTLFLFLAMFTNVKKRLDRWEAGVLVGTYIIYTLYLIFYS